VILTICRQIRQLRWEQLVQQNLLTALLQQNLQQSNNYS